MSRDLIYKDLCKRIIPYLSKIYSDVTISLIKRGAAEGLQRYYVEVDSKIGARDGFACFEDCYEACYVRLIRFRPAKQFLREEMSPEEVDLQLSIRGF